MIYIMKIYDVFFTLVIVMIPENVFCKSFIFDKHNRGSKNIQDAHDGSYGIERKHCGEFNDNFVNKKSLDGGYLKFHHKRETQRKRSPYGLVYNRGIPIGILQPISQSFQISNYDNRKDYSRQSSEYDSEQFPAKRNVDDYLEDENDTDNGLREENSAAVRSNNYPSVLTKFKVSNKVKNRNERNDQTNDKTDKARKENVEVNKVSQPNKLEDKEIDDVEEDLKGVMGDMGLVEKKNENAEIQGAKRDIYDEDQNFEDGLNKIDSMKVSYFKRRERASSPDKAKIEKGNAHCKGSKCMQITNNNGNEKKTCSKEARARGECKRGAKAIKEYAGKDKHIANYQYEGEAYLRNKRQEKENMEMLKAENDEIVKNLEASGELTVSGNKSPLATKNEDLLRSSEQEKQEKDAEYEKRLERNIQTKINQIKNEVKREIHQIKANSGQRMKRQVENTLLDGETRDLDPSIDNDQELEPYVRKRRDVEESDSDSLEDVGKDKRDTDSGVACKGTHDDEDENLNGADVNDNNTQVQRDERSDDVSDANHKLVQADPNDDVVKRNELTDNNKVKEKDNLENSEDAQVKNIAKSKRDLKNEVATKNDESTILKNDADNNNYLDKRKTNLEQTNVLHDPNENIKPIFKRSNSELPAVDASTNTNVNDGALSKRKVASEDVTKPIEEYGEKNQVRQTKEAETKNGDEKNEEIDVNKRESAENGGKAVNEKAVENSPPAKRSCEANVEVPGKKVGANSVQDSKNSLGQKEALGGETNSKIHEEDENMERSKRGIDVKSSYEDFDIDKITNPHKRMDNFEDGEQIAKKLDTNKLADYEDPNVSDQQDIQSTDSKRTADLSDDVGHEENLYYSPFIDKRKRNVFDSNNNGYADSKSNDISHYNDDNFETYDEEDGNNDNFNDEPSAMKDQRQALTGADDWYDDLEDYPSYMERDKRNTYRNLISEESDPKNFLFYPARYGRKRRRNAEENEEVEDNPYGRHARVSWAEGGRSLNENYRNKRLQNRRERHGSKVVDSLADSEIFGELPQSYEGERSRFKRVKRIASHRSP